MNIIVDRRWKKETYTIGAVYVDGERFSESMEDKDRGLTQDMSLEEITKKKVYGKTAIPKGKYELAFTVSPKFKNRIWGKKYKGRVLEILNVKGFSGVRIHPLNTAADSLGCIGLGKNNVKGMVTQSISYYYRLLDEYVLPAFRRGEKVNLIIR